MPTGIKPFKIHWIPSCKHGFAADMRCIECYVEKLEKRIVSQDTRIAELESLLKIEREHRDNKSKF